MNVVKIDTSREDLGRTNRRLVLAEIIRSGHTNRTEIAQRIGLTNASVSRITRDFLDAGLIRESAPAAKASGPGRKTIGLGINPAAGGVLGIGINAFQQSITLSDLSNEVIERREFSLSDLADSGSALRTIADAALEVISASGMPRERIFGCSVAVTGSVDPARGVVMSAAPLGWTDVDVRSVLEERLELDVHVENLPNAMNLAETQFGCARERRNVVLINASLGLGISLFLDGRLFRGHGFAAGLIGDLRMPIAEEGAVHMKSVDDIAAGRAVLRAMDLDPQEDGAVNLLALMQNAAVGDGQMETVFASAGRALRPVIETVAAIIHPEQIVLSGPLTRVPAYVDAAVAPAGDESTTVKENIPIVVSDITSQRAARLLAISEYLMHRDVDLGRLGRRAA